MMRVPRLAQRSMDFALSPWRCARKSTSTGSSVSGDVNLRSVTPRRFGCAPCTNTPGWLAEVTARTVTSGCPSSSRSSSPPT